MAVADAILLPSPCMNFNLDVGPGSVLKINLGLAHGYLLRKPGITDSERLQPRWVVVGLAAAVAEKKTVMLIGEPP